MLPIEITEATWAPAKHWVAAFECPGMYPLAACIEIIYTYINCNLNYITITHRRQSRKSGWNHLRLVLITSKHDAVVTSWTFTCLHAVTEQGHWQGFLVTRGDTHHRTSFRLYASIQQRAVLHAFYMHIITLLAIPCTHFKIANVPYRVSMTPAVMRNLGVNWRREGEGMLQKTKLLKH